MDTMYGVVRFLLRAAPALFIFIVAGLFLFFFVGDYLRERYWQRKSRELEMGEGKLEEFSPGHISPRRRDGVRRFAKDYSKPVQNRPFQGRVNEPVDPR